MQIKAYAIDFGTSNSLLAAASSAGVIPPIPLDPLHPSDPSILRSVIFSARPKEWSFGHQAIEDYAEWGNEGRLLRSLKKFLPRPQFTGTQIHGRWVELEELIGLFLRTMRERANLHFQQDVSSVVLGRPALFSENATEDKLAEDRLRRGALRAGFKEIHFCAEPEAAAYEFRRQLKEEKLVLIADFGGGTTDFTLVKLGPKPFRREDVLATHGLSVAGDAFDGNIMEHHLLPFFGSEMSYRLPMGHNWLKLPPHLMLQLCSAAEISLLNRQDVKELVKNAKNWSLSTKESEVQIARLLTLIEENLGYALFQEIEKSKKQFKSAEKVPFDFNYPDINLHTELSRASFQHHSLPLVDSITACLEKTLKLANIEASSIDLVCCTGGTAQLRQLHARLSEIFGAEKIWQHNFFHSVIEGLSEVAREKFF